MKMINSFHIQSCAFCVPELVRLQIVHDTLTLQKLNRVPSKEKKHIAIFYDRLMFFNISANFYWVSMQLFWLKQLLPVKGQQSC